MSNEREEAYYIDSDNEGCGIYIKHEAGMCTQVTITNRKGVTLEEYLSPNHFLNFCMRVIDIAGYEVKKKRGGIK